MFVVHEFRAESMFHFVGPATVEAIGTSCASDLVGFTIELSARPRRTPTPSVGEAVAGGLCGGEKAPPGPVDVVGDPPCASAGGIRGETGAGERLVGGGAEGAGEGLVGEGAEGACGC